MSSFSRSNSTTSTRPQSASHSHILHRTSSSEVNQRFASPNPSQGNHDHSSELPESLLRPAEDVSAHSQAFPSAMSEREKQLEQRIRSQEEEIMRLKAALVSPHRSSPQSSRDNIDRDKKHFSDDALPGFVLRSMKIRCIPSGGVGSCSPPNLLGGHSLVSVGERVIAFGGLIAKDEGEEEALPMTGVPCSSNAVYSFHTTKCLWTILQCGGDLPAPRSGHTATVVGGMMVIYGGERGERQGESSAAKVSRPKRKRPSVTPSIVDRNAEENADGGQRNTEKMCEASRRILSSVYSLDLSTGVWRMMPPHSEGARTAALKGHSAAAVGNKLYVFGGTEGASSSCSSSSPTAAFATNKMRCLDLTTGMWEDEDALNRQLAKINRFRAEGRKIDTALNALNDSEEMKQLSRCVPSPRAGHSMVYSKALDSFFIVGGFVDCNGQMVEAESQPPLTLSSALVHAYHRSRRAWSAILPRGVGPSSASSSFCTAMLGDSNLLVVEALSGDAFVLDIILSPTTPNESGGVFSDCEWHSIPFAEHSRLPRKGVIGRSAVALPAAAGAGPSPPSSAPHPLSAARGDNKACSVLLFGGGGMGSGASSPRASKVSREMWRIDVGGEAALAVLQEARRRREAQCQSPHRPLGPPRCATPSPPRTAKLAASPPASPAAARYQRRQSSATTPRNRSNSLSNSNNKSGGQLIHPRPFSSQTSRRMSRQYFSSYAPSDAIGGGFAPPPSPRKKLDGNDDKLRRPRTKEEIQKIVDRVSNTKVVEEKRRELEERYLFKSPAKKRPQLTEEEEEASVNRLYYDEIEAREERMAELEMKYYPELPEPDMTEEEVYESAERLYSAGKMLAGPTSEAASARRNHNHGVAAADDEGPDEDASMAASPSSKLLAPLDPKQKATVDRLYYEQLTKSREHRQKLEDRYLFHASKK